MRPRPDVRTIWIARTAAVISVAVLLGLATAYYFTYEPAPEIRIRWRHGLPTERVAELERRFRLVNRKPSEDRFSYDLLDTRPENVKALVNERDIEDTDRVDREGSTIPPDAPYGESWMWAAHRLPVLRTPGVTEGIVAACSVVLAASVAVLMRTRPSRGGRPGSEEA